MTELLDLIKKLEESLLTQTLINQKFKEKFDVLETLVNEQTKMINHLMSEPAGERGVYNA